MVQPLCCAIEGIAVSLVRMCSHCPASRNAPEVFAGGFGTSSYPRSAYPQLQGQPFHACHRCSKAAPAARQIHRICPSKGFALCFTFEARCEAAQTGQPSFKGRPVYAAVRARLVTRLRVADSSFLMCAAALHYFDSTFYYSLRQNIPSNREIAVYTYISASLSYMYNPLFKGTLHEPERAKALSLRFGLELLLRSSSYISSARCR